VRRRPAPSGSAGWWPRVFVLAGLCDAATGVLLVVAPLLTLRLMRIEPPPAEPAYVRFLGAFVLSVGIAYLLAFLPLAAARRRRRTVIEVTAVTRGVVALVVGTAIAAGALTASWWPVAAFDGGLCLLQVAVLAGHGAAWLDGGPG
jgi:hypothetical protein